MISDPGEERRFQPSTDCPLWRPSDGGPFFRECQLEHRQQEDGACVPTSLAIVSGGQPIEFQTKDVNTQDPVSWSDALRAYGMKLAYCPTDIRRLKFYMPDVLNMDDLFLLCYYCPHNEEDVLTYPRPERIQCPSHVVVLHRDHIFNAGRRGPEMADGNPCGERFTKRIFRLVPDDHHRGL